MNCFEKLLYFLQSEMKTPNPYGWFHWLCIGLMLIFILILYIRKKYYNEKQIKIVLGIYGFVALTLEILKQLIWSFNYDQITNIITWDYQWYAFPFQLCTTPIYVSLICLFMKKSKIRDSLLSYMSFVTILGSITTILIPDSCFTSDILVNIHTMWLHLGSFVVSIYLLMVGEVKVKFDYLKKSLIVFLIFVSIALCLNLLVYNSGILNEESFNMFYISPYFISSLPVFDVIQQHVHYIIYLIIYTYAIAIGSCIIYCIAKTIKNISHKNK